MSQSLDPFKKIDTNNLKQTHWKMGTFDLIVKNMGPDLLIGTSNKHEYIIPESKDYREDALDWQRWIKPSNNQSIDIHPEMPDRSLIISPKDILNIPSGGKADFFITIPLWLNLSITTKKKSVSMMRLATEILSDSWFGDPVEGEYCYSLKTKARREIDPAHVPENRVICPITIENKSEESMLCSRFCIRTEYLNLFKINDSFWTNHVSIKFRSNTQGSRINYEQNPPKDATLITPSRETPPHNLIRKTFHLS